MEPMSKGELMSFGVSPSPCGEIEYMYNDLIIYFTFIRFVHKRQFTCLRYQMSLIPLSAFFLVSCCLSISGNNQAANWAGEDAFITMKVHLMHCPKGQITEVFGAYNTTFNSCMKFFNVAIEIANLGEGLCTD